MKLLLAAYVATIAVACVAASHAWAAPNHDAQVTAFFKTHPRLARTPAGQLALLQIKVRQLDARLRSLQAARPAHLALWRCIAGYPGARPGGGSGESGGYTGASNGSHFNVLQMTNPWQGINPIGLSAAAIMRAAESGYAASGFSRAWLGGQWGQTMGPCWGFA